MRVTYLKLENIAGLKVGSDRSSIEIDFSNSRNKIVSIQGRNGAGKTVLLSAITPFSGVTALDDRSTLSYITPHKNGYKEIHYIHDGSQFIIKHYYKATKDTHSVKSYFSKDGEELNENGNVTSFLELVKVHFGLTPEMLRLIRLGTNVNSFITLIPAKRKEYIGRLIEEIDLYLLIHKKINEDIRVIRSLLNVNSSRLQNCHIPDVVVEEERLKKLSKDIKQQEKERDKLVSRISRITALMNDNNAEELRRKRREAEGSIAEFQRTEAFIHQRHLEDVTVEQLIKRRSDLTDQKVDVQSKINSYRISIDTAMKSIERLEVSVRKVTSDSDLQSLRDAISITQASIQNVDRIVRDFAPIGKTNSADVSSLIMRLQSFNQISQMILTFGNSPIEMYLKLRKEGRSVEKFLKDQSKKRMAGISEANLKFLMDQAFQEYDIITPNCGTEYVDCPYYRFSDVIASFRSKLAEETFDDETLRYIQVIATNVDNILNEIDRMTFVQLPDQLKEILQEKSILNRLDAKLPFFELSGLHEYLSLMKAHELYVEDVERLRQYEHQLSIYKKSGVEGQMDEIKSYQERIGFYRNNIGALSGDISRIEGALAEVDDQITLVSRYIDSKKYQKFFQSMIESTNKILKPLETAEAEKQSLDFSLWQVTSAITQLRNEHRQLEGRIKEYRQLMDEDKRLSKKFRHLEIIQKSVSTRKGIPVIFMQRYLGKIQKLANRLLQVAYDGELQLAKFHVSQDTFEVPYVKNGVTIPDVKYASQSEVALMTMALSFALANHSSGNYNILLLDEVESGLDEENRSAFLKMLEMQMSALQAEQTFMISHNMSQMVNVPMDCIFLTETRRTSKLQTVIFE